MDDEEGFFAFHFPPHFPMDDMLQILSDLMAGSGIVAGYIPTEGEILDLMVMKLMPSKNGPGPDQSSVTSLLDGRIQQ